MKKDMLNELKASFYEGNRLNSFMAQVIDIFSLAANVIVSWLLQQMMDSASGEPGSYSLKTLIWMTVGLIVFLLLLMESRRKFLPEFLRKAILQYKNLVYRRLSMKNLSSFAQEDSSTYLSALSNDIPNIEMNYLESRFTIVALIVQFFATLALVLYYSPLLTLVAIACMSVPILASVFIGNKVAVYEKQVSDVSESFISQLKDSLTGFSVIKSFQAEEEMAKQFADSNERTENAKFSKRQVEGRVEQITSVAGFSAQMATFLFGTYMIMSKQDMSVGRLMAIVNLVGTMLGPIQQLSVIFAKRKAAAGLIEKMAGLLEENVDDQGIEVDQYLDDKLIVNDLQYAYEEGKDILKGLSVEIPSGQAVAVVGGSGSGKSTLFHLMMGADRNYRGTIHYDGIELREISTSSLYDMIGLIQQNVFIFKAGIKDNVTLYKEFPREQLETAVEHSGLKELWTNKGADYDCGENGAHLSGGERQRIAIARSLLRKNSVLLVDEATSALDAETAAKVTQSILDLEGTTRLVITHRLEASLLRKYDRILVLKDGKVAEDGSFDELMDKKEYFYSLYTMSQ